MEINWILYYTAAFVTNIAVLVFFYRRYGTKIVLHPVTYFSLMWVLSLASFFFFNIAGLNIVTDELVLNELFIFVALTAFFALFWSFKSRLLVKKSIVNLRLFIPEKIFKFFVIIFFISALFLLFQSGFDVAGNREIKNNNVFNSVNSSLGILNLITGVISMLSLPFTVYSGFKIGSFYIRGVKSIKYFYFLPLITAVIETISGGGRSGIVSSFLIFSIGFLLGFFSYNNQNIKKKLRPLLKYVFVSFLVFSLYSGYVSAQRSLLEDRGEQSDYTTILLKRFPYLSSVSGTLEYLVFHFQGYQWRRHDSMSPDLEWGKNTFAFITQFNVPIISQLSGYNFSIGNIFDIKHTGSVEGTINAFDENKTGASITATVYFLLYKDFGFGGAILAIFLFTGLTQKLFERLFKINNTNFWSIIFFLAIYKLWTLTFFSHHLNGAWFNNYLYPILIIEVINIGYKHNKS